MEQEPIRYHVIYRSGKQTRVLGRIAGVPATSFTLDPFLSRLLLAGIRHGDILLVEETTRRIGAHRSASLCRTNQGSCKGCWCTQDSAPAPLTGSLHVAVWAG